MTSTNPKRFILLGDAGSGKSSLINFFHNFFYGTKALDEIFCERPKVKLAIPCANWLDCLDSDRLYKSSEQDINDQTKSQTQQCTTYVFQAENIHLQIIDTPGFNDTNGTDVDERNLTSIEQTLKEGYFLSGIIIVANGSFPRLNVSFKNFLNLLHQVWPNDLLNNCVAILTNCDELSVNLDPSVLHNELNIDKNKTFYFQNSLFRWDRQNISTRTIRRFQQDFQDNLEKVGNLRSTLLQFNEVSTEVFEAGAIKTLLIEQYIFKSVKTMIELIQAYKEQQITKEGMEGARSTMETNKKWEKHQEINAISWTEVARDRPSSPPTSPLQPKFTRQSILSDTSSKLRSVIPFRKDHKSDMVKVQSSEQKQSHSHALDYHNNSTKARTLSTDDNKYKSVSSSVNQSDNRKELSSQTNNYSSVYKNPPQNKIREMNVSPSKSIGVHHQTSADVSYHQPLKTKSLDDRSYRQDEHYTKSSGYPDNKIGASYHSTNSSYGHVYRPQQTKIQVTIPDNEARSRHDNAQQQEWRLQDRSEDLKHEQDLLSSKIKSLLNQLRRQVADLYSINKNYNILEKNRDLLMSFKEIIKYFGDNSELEDYYEETIRILQKK